MRITSSTITFSTLKKLAFKTDDKNMPSPLMRPFNHQIPVMDSFSNNYAMKLILTITDTYLMTHLEHEDIKTRVPIFTHSTKPRKSKVNYPSRT